MKRLLLELTVEGEPRAKGRPRFANGHAFTPKATRLAEQAFMFDVRSRMKWLEGRYSGPLEVVLVFHTKTARRVDLDNLAKLALDACNGVVWADDSQIRSLQVRREVGGRPRTEMRVYEITEEAA